MNSDEELLSRANERLRGLSAKRLRLPDSGKELVAGQLWTVPGLRQDEPTWLYLLLEHLGGDLFNAAICFRWTEWAGPDDLYLPAELADATLIVSFELEGTVCREMLASCCERLPPLAMEYVLRARAVRDNPVEREAFTWGLAYFGQHCSRLARHEAINIHLEALQASVRAQVFAVAAAPARASIPTIVTDTIAQIAVSARQKYEELVAALEAEGATLLDNIRAMVPEVQPLVAGSDATTPRLRPIGTVTIDNTAHDVLTFGRQVIVRLKGEERPNNLLVDGLPFPVDVLITSAGVFAVLGGGYGRADAEGLVEEQHTAPSTHVLRWDTEKEKAPWSSNGARHRQSD